jgi:hypothetical protein
LRGYDPQRSDFDHVAPHLLRIEAVRLIRMDYRGRSQSDWADPASYDPEIRADAIAL